MKIEPVADPGAEWDDFVEKTPGATLAHAAAWARILADAYRLEPVYRAARDESGSLRGVLPLFRFRTLRGDLELVSVPFHDTGGVLARDPEAEGALLGDALALARASGARRIDLRQPTPLASAHPPPALGRVDLVLPLEADETAQWEALPGKARNQTRKAGREGLRLLEGGDLAAAFYEPFCVNMRDLGSPVHGETFFRSAAEAFGDRMRFIVARGEAGPVSGLVAIHFAGAVAVPWAASLRAERPRCPNHLIYWEAIRWAVARGATEFGFGRSPQGSGTHRFKKGWGARERRLAWLLLDPGGALLPRSAPADSRLLRSLSSLWVRLPLALTRKLGPPVRRRLSS